MIKGVDKLIFALFAAAVVVATIWHAFGVSPAGPMTPMATSTPASSAGMMDFRSEEVGLSFSYPDRYTLEMHHEGESHVLTLLPAGYAAPEAGEGPPAISAIIFNNAEGLPLEEFLKSEPGTNFQLSADQKLTAVTVGGEAGLAYTHSGLYESDAVAVARPGSVFVFSAGWSSPQDAIRTDFQTMLKTVRFTDPHEGH